MDVNVDARKLGKAVTVKVNISHLREFEIRVWIAVKLILLVAKIGRFNFEYDKE